MGVLDAAGLSYFWGKVKAALSGKQNTITAGDGLSKDGDTLSVKNPVRGILTQAEYDALSEEQKASGTYFVDDGGGAGGGLAEEIYSTEERRIGTWIDGRPLYRKTVQGDRVAPGELIAHIDEAEYRRFYGTITSENGTIRPIPFVSTTVSSNVGIQKTSSGDVSFTGANALNFTYIITLEYTKTTDEATVSTAEIVAAALDGLPAEDLNALAEAAANDGSAGEGGVT